MPPTDSGLLALNGPHGLLSQLNSLPKSNLTVVAQPEGKSIYSPSSHVSSEWINTKGLTEGVVHRFVVNVTKNGPSVVFLIHVRLVKTTSAWDVASAKVH